MRQKLVSGGAHCTIQMRSNETDVKKAVELLSRDLLNGTLVFIHIAVLISAQSLGKSKSQFRLPTVTCRIASQYPLPIMMISQHHRPPSSMRVGIAATMMKVMTILKVCMQIV